MPQHADARAVEGLRLRARERCKPVSRSPQIDERRQRESHPAAPGVVRQERDSKLQARDGALVANQEIFAIAANRADSAHGELLHGKQWIVRELNDGSQRKLGALLADAM